MSKECEKIIYKKIVSFLKSFASIGFSSNHIMCCYLSLTLQIYFIDHYFKKRLNKKKFNQA